MLTSKSNTSKAIIFLCIAMENKSMKDFKKEFGQHLKILREKNNITQEKLSELINYSVINISRVENGHVFPSLEVILSYADVFNLQMKDLFDFEKNIESKLSSDLEKLNKLLQSAESRYTKVIHDIAKSIIINL